MKKYDSYEDVERDYGLFHTSGDIDKMLNRMIESGLVTAESAWEFVAKYYGGHFHGKSLNELVYFLTGSRDWGSLADDWAHTNKKLYY
jgi:hypothetical protein